MQPSPVGAIGTSGAQNNAVTKTAATAGCALTSTNAYGQDMMYSNLQMT